MEIFLNRAELSLNSANSGNLKIAEAWTGLNLKTLSLHVPCWHCGSILVSHTKRVAFEPFYCNDIFLSLNSANSLKHLEKTPLPLKLCRAWILSFLNLHLFEWIWAGDEPEFVRWFPPSCYFHQCSNIKKKVIILAATNVIYPEINV